MHVVLHLARRLQLLLLVAKDLAQLSLVVLDQSLLLLLEVINTLLQLLLLKERGIRKNFRLLLLCFRSVLFLNSIAEQRRGFFLLWWLLLDSVFTQYSLELPEAVLLLLLRVCQLLNWV